MTGAAAIKSIDIVERRVNRTTMNIVMSVASDNEIEAMKWFLDLVSENPDATAAFVTVGELQALMTANSTDGQWNGADICDALAWLITSRGGQS